MVHDPLMNVCNNPNPQLLELLILTGNVTSDAMVSETGEHPSSKAPSSPLSILCESDHGVPHLELLLAAGLLDRASLRVDEGMVLLTFSTNFVFHHQIIMR